MKKFTDTQKKWALTATMIAALGCSVSFNPQKPGDYSSDFASTGIKDEFTLDKKDLKVKYYPAGKNKTTAIVTGLGTCDECSFVLNEKLSKESEDLEALQVALVAKITEQKDEATDEEDEDSEVDERSERRRERDEERAEARKEREERAAEARKEKKKAVADYKTIKKRMKLAYCEDERDKSSCLANEFLTLIEENDFSEKAVYKYFTGELESKIVNQVMDKSPLDPRNPYFGSKGSAALDTLELLLRDMPGEYESLKERIVYMGAQALHRSASLQQGLLEQYASTGSLEDKNIAREQQRWTREISQRLKMAISPQAILNGVENGEISFDMATAMYNNNYRVYSDSITRGVEQWTTAGQPVNINAYTLPDLQYANIAGLEGVQAPQVRGQQAVDLSTRLLQERLQGNRTSNVDPSVVPMLQQNTRDINFGSPITIQSNDPIYQQIRALRASPNFHPAQ